MHQGTVVKLNPLNCRHKRTIVKGNSGAVVHNQPRPAAAAAMLSADKDLLLAKLNQDLLALHLLELNTVLNRFQNTIGASSLLGGFAYAAIIQAELDIGWRGNPDQLVSEAVFFLAASITLSLAMFAMSVSTYASVGLIASTLTLTLTVTEP
jgi:hypothetical protein